MSLSEVLGVLGAICAVLGVIVAVYGYGRMLERRLTALETWRDAVNARIEDLDRRIEKRLANIERKQDELLIRLFKQPVFNQTDNHE
jgi:hypothetical protein